MPTPLISTVDAKAHCRVFHTQDDAYIADIVTRVVDEWQSITHYPLAATQMIQVIESQPEDGVIRHYFGGVDVTAGGTVEWTDGTLQTETIDESQYQVLDGYVTLPITDAQAGTWVYPISYTYTAGVLALPPRIRTALLLRIGYLYSYRGDDASPPDTNAWQMLCAQHRTRALL